MDKNTYKRIFLIEQILAAIFSLSNKLQATGDNYCKEITVRQMMVIVALLHLPEDKTTINNIAKKLNCTKQSTKHIIDSLVKKNYVEVKPSRLDKRSVNISLTKLGKEISIQVMGSAEEFFKDISAELSINEMENMWMLLKKLYSFDGDEMDGFEEEVGFKLFEE